MKEKKEAHKKAIKETLYKLNDKEDLKTNIDNKVNTFSSFNLCVQLFIDLNYLLLVNITIK